jgi:hypothetical protein
MNRKENDESNSVRIGSPLADSQTEDLPSMANNPSTTMFNFIPFRGTSKILTNKQFSITFQTVY